MDSGIGCAGNIYATGRMALLRIDTSKACTNDYEVAKWNYTGTPPMMTMGRDYLMYLQFVDGNISCSFDFNSDGVLDNSDPIITYTDTAPLAKGPNIRAGVWSYDNQEGGFRKLSFQQCYASAPSNSKSHYQINRISHIY